MENTLTNTTDRTVEIIKSMGYEVPKRLSTYNYWEDGKQLHRFAFYEGEDMYGREIVGCKESDAVATFMRWFTNRNNDSNNISNT